MTRARQEPRGASTSTTSPGLAPRRAPPSGESGETPPTLEISTVIRSPFSSSTSTVDPIPTSPLADDAWSTSTARSKRSRIVLIRASSRPCSFFAAWYSKFSDRSPKPLAVEIAWTTSLRRGPSSWASSDSSRCFWSAVIGSCLSPDMGGSLARLLWLSCLPAQHPSRAATT